MAHSQKKPPIKVVFTKIQFNYILDSINLEKEKSKKLFDKLLKYSVPFERDGTELIEIRLFINEAVETMRILVNEIDITSKHIDTDYYNDIKTAREKLVNEE